MPRVPENIPTRDSTNANRPVSFHEQAVRYHNSHPDLVHDGISTPSRCQEISPHKFEGYPPIRRGLKWLIRIAIFPSRSVSVGKPFRRKMKCAFGQRSTSAPSA